MSKGNLLFRLAVGEFLDASLVSGSLIVFSSPSDPPGVKFIFPDKSKGETAVSTLTAKCRTCGKVLK